MEQKLLNYLDIQKHNVFYLKTSNWIRPATAKSYNAIVDENSKVCADDQNQIDEFIEYFDEYEPLGIGQLYKLYKSIEENDDKALNLDKSKIVHKSNKSEFTGKDKKLIKFFTNMINDINNYIEETTVDTLEKAYDCFISKDDDKYVNIGYEYTISTVSENTAKKRDYVNRELKICAYDQRLYDRLQEYLTIKIADQELEQEEQKMLDDDLESDREDDLESDREDDLESDSDDDLEVKTNNEYEYRCRKLSALSADKFYNFDTNREVAMSTACKKNAYCLELKCCSDNVDSFQNFIAYMSEKHNKKYECSIKSISSPAKAAKDRNSYKKANITKVIRDDVWFSHSPIKNEAKCYCCRTKEITYGVFEAGHIIAEARGGKTIAENLRPICTSCNRTMQTKNLFDFMKDTYPESFKLAMQSESITIYLNTYNDGEYSLDDFYKNYVKYCRSFKVIPMNKNVVRYYLKGQEVLDDGKVIIGNIDYDSDSD